MLLGEPPFGRRSAAPVTMPWVLAIALAACGDDGAKDGRGDAATPVDAALPTDAARNDGGAAHGGVGAACDPSRPTPSRCAEGLECIAPDRLWPDGYCTKSCGPDAPCPGDALCGEAPGAPGTPICMAPCTEHADCRLRQGYLCAPLTAGSACVQVLEPLGRRDGEACFTVDAGPHGIGALPRNVFADGDRPLSGEGRTFVSGAEIDLAVRPDGLAAATAFIATDGDGQRVMGISVFDADAVVLHEASLRPPSEPYSGDPVIAYTTDGRLHVVFMGFSAADEGDPGLAVRMYAATSEDDGATFDAPHAVDPEGTCSVGCDKPWLVAGPSPESGGDSLYLLYTAVQGLVCQRSDDGGTTFGAPRTVAGAEFAPEQLRVPFLPTMAVDDGGVLHVAYLHLPFFGDRFVPFHPQTEVRYVRSDDGCETFTRPVTVSAPGEEIATYQPPISVTTGSKHIGYVRGGVDGAWDIMLASGDGSSPWTRRRVNDEPETCATHLLAAMTADVTTGALHMIWLDDRIGEGQVVYGQCPAAPGASCIANEAVGTVGFPLTTDRPVNRWHGDYIGIGSAPEGRIYAAFSDTRSGSPQVYFAVGHALDPGSSP